MPKRTKLLTDDQARQMANFSPDPAQQPDPDAQAVDAGIRQAFPDQAQAFGPGDLDRQAQAMRQAVSFGAGQDPDQYAKLLALQEQTGVAPQLAQGYQKQLQKSATVNSIDYPMFVATAPKTAAWVSDPHNAAIAHDDLGPLSQIENGAEAMRRPVADAIWNEGKSAAGNINNAFLGAFKPFVDAAGVAVQGMLESPKPAMDFLTGLDPDAEELKDVWVNPRRWKVQDWLTQPVMDWATGGTIQPQAGSPWYGRSLVNQLEGVPGALAAFLLTGKLGGLGAEAATAAPETEGILGAVAPGAAMEAKTVPAILGTQAAQTTYAQARARGADQKTAVLAAITSGVTNYSLMGQMPGAAPAESVTGALGQWAGRSAAMGAGMTLADNAEARSYDPERSLTEGWQQSVATMAAFEGVGAIGHVIDAVEASKLRTRSPEKFQQAADAFFEGQESLRVPAQEFVKYFDAQKLDPAVVANRLGVTNLEEAAAGADLEIPPANFFGKLEPEHQKGLLPDVVDPRTDLTTRQTEAAKAELQDWMANGGAESLAAEFTQADSETQATPEWKQVYSDLKQRYADAGESETSADNYATLHANAIANLARKAGLKPDELLQMHNPKIVEGEAPEGAGPQLYQEAIEGIRSVVEAARQPGHAPQKVVIAPVGSWLVDTAKAQGFDIDGFKHSVDGSAIRHIIAHHGESGSEISRGQLPVMDADFEKIPEILDAPDRVVFGTRNKLGRDQIGYVKQMPDGSVLYLEEMRNRRHELAAVSMRKYPATKDIDRLATNLPLYGRTDSGDKPIVVRPPNADKGETLYQSGGRKQRNIDAAKNQGGLLKATFGAAREEGAAEPAPDGAWHQHDTEGSFESIACVAEGAEDVLYAVINRTIGGQTVRYVERMASRKFGDITNAFFVDAGATQSFANPVTQISGLTWLEGQTVAVLADGAVQSKKVVTGGAITLDHKAKVVQIGLPAPAGLRPCKTCRKADEKSSLLISKSIALAPYVRCPVYALLCRNLQWPVATAANFE